MGNELSGILQGTGAKMKGEVLDGHVAFRGAVKADVPFEEIVAQARGTLLVLSFRGHVVELGAGGRASQLAAKVRSPPSRVERMGIPFGVSAAVAGTVDAALRAELAGRADVAAAAPPAPVDVLVYGAEGVGGLDPLARLARLVKPGGSLWLLAPRDVLPANQVAMAAKASGLRVEAAVPLPPTHVATRLAKPS